MNWLNTLKMVYDDSWRFEKEFPVYDDNPYVFLDDDRLPDEYWDDVSEKGQSKTYGRSWYQSVTAPPTKDRWVSNFGRVKEDDKIVVPEMTGYGFGVWFKGDKENYKQNRAFSGKKHGASKRVGSSGKVLVKWNITVDWAKENNITIPDKAPVYGDAYSNMKEGNYGQWKNGELFETRKEKKLRIDAAQKKEEERKRKAEERERRKAEREAEKSAAFAQKLEEERRERAKEQEKRDIEEKKKEAEQRATGGMGPGRSRRRKLPTTRGPPRKGSDKKASVWFNTIRGIV